MKIVLINHSDTRGGASVVTFRLMQALQAAGHEARMLVVHKATDSPWVYPAASSFACREKFLAEHLRIFVANGFSRKNLFKISIATDGLPLYDHPLVKDADVVVLNWVNQGVLSIDGIRRIADERPVVWTMHDMWCATGVCHHAGPCDGYLDRCGNCPLVRGGSRRHDISRTTYRRKSELYSRSNIHFVAVSRWLASKCSHSSLLSHRNVEVIPNAFPIDEFSYEATGLPRKKRIVMGAARLDDPIKDFPLAVASLNAFAASRPDLAEGTEVLFYGNMSDSSALKKVNMPYRWLGCVSSTELPAIYSGADAVLSTSLYETLPGTLVEGMAGGCVPVATAIGGQADIVDHLRTGYLSSSRKPDDLARGLVWALESGPARAALHAEVESRFSAASVAEKYIALFNNILKK